MYPSGLIPSLLQIGNAMQEKLVLDLFQNIGLYYNYPLMASQENFKNY
jgi:cyclopropane-fatty-acyl-phospholipid synthase